MVGRTQFALYLLLIPVVTMFFVYFKDSNNIESFTLSLDQQYYKKELKNKREVENKNEEIIIQKDEEKLDINKDIEVSMKEDMSQKSEADKENEENIGEFINFLKVSKEEKNVTLFVNKKKIQENNNQLYYYAQDEYVYFDSKQLSVLPDIDLGWENQYKTCSIVGNSGRVLETEYGNDIDNSDAIFRINEAPIIGFEKHVGTRTTFRYLNALYAGGRKRSSRFSKNNPDQYEFMRENSNIIFELRPKDFIPYTGLVEEIERDNEEIKCFAHHPHFQMMKNKITLDPSFEITSGFKLFLLAYFMCDNVIFYGFDRKKEYMENVEREKNIANGGEDKNTRKYHYYDKTIPGGGFSKTHHDFLREYNIYDKLEKLNMIELR